MSDTIKRIVIDESVSISKLERFEAFARKKGFWASDRLYIRQAHPGMPDGQILHHFLDHTTVLVTADRPFHNKVLSKGFHIERLRRKLKDLARDPMTNEIVPGNIQELCTNFKVFDQRRSGDSEFVQK